MLCQEYTPYVRTLKTHNHITASKMGATVTCMPVTPGLFRASHRRGLLQVHARCQSVWYSSNASFRLWYGTIGESHNRLLSAGQLNAPPQEMMERRQMSVPDDSNKEFHRPLQRPH